jgi:hypothetical protein
MLCSDDALCCVAAADLRNGSLRKKFDALKYTLKKLEVGLLGVCINRITD